MGKAEESLIHFRRALDLKPGYEDAARGIGEVYLETGRHAEGLAAMEKAFGMIRFDLGAGITVRGGDAP